MRSLITTELTAQYSLRLILKSQNITDREIYHEVASKIMVFTHLQISVLKLVQIVPYKFVNYKVILPAIFVPYQLPCPELFRNNPQAYGLILFHASCFARPAQLGAVTLLLNINLSTE